MVVSGTTMRTEGWFMNTNHQYTFEEYLRFKNKAYAWQCRHCVSNYCYIAKDNIDNLQCPCSDFEEHKFCYGCHYDRSFGKAIPKTCFTCYRYAFNPDVKTQDVSDKWQEAEDGND